MQVLSAKCWSAGIGKRRKFFMQVLSAVKIVRGIKKYREAAMIEIEVLQELGRHDRGGTR